MAHHIGPRFISNTKDEVDYEAEPEEASEEAIGTNTGVVAVERAFNWTLGADVLAGMRSRRRDSHRDFGNERTK